MTSEKSNTEQYIILEIKNSNAEYKKIYNKKYFEKNKQILKQKIICTECNGEYTKINKFRHMHTKKHLTALLANKVTMLAHELNSIKNSINV